MDINKILKAEISSDIFSRFKKTRIYEMRSYFIIFILCIFIIRFANFIFSFSMLGDKTVLVFDMRAQYIYYFEALNDAFRGNGSMFISWSKVLSGEMIGVFAYYLASPFSIIPVIFPKEYILESVFLMQIVKAGACGITFNYYLRNSKGIKNYKSVVFSLCYALSMYAVVNSINTMFIDGVFYLPLVIYAIEKLVDDKKMLRFTVTFALAVFANFYTAYMIGIFSVIYLFVYLFILSDKSDYSYKEKINSVLRFMISGLISGLSVAALLVPLYFSLKLGKMDYSVPDFTPHTRFSIMGFLSELLPASYDILHTFFYDPVTDKIERALPMVYSGVISVIMLPLFFMNSKISKKIKMGYGILLSIMFVSMYISTFDIVWHGFQEPNSSVFRQAFIFGFVFVCMAAQSLDKIDGVSPKQVVGVSLVIIAFIVIMESIGIRRIDTGAEVILSVAAVIVLAVIICYYKKHESTKWKPVFMVSCVVAELLCSVTITMNDIDREVVYLGDQTFKAESDQMNEIVDNIEKNEKGSFFRMDMFENIATNTAIAVGYKGITHFSSLMNVNVMRFFQNMGLESNNAAVMYMGSTKLLDDLIGMKYIIYNFEKNMIADYANLSDNDGVSPINIHPYDVITENEKFKIIKNDDALGMGFMVDKDIMNVDLSSENPFENQNNLLNSMISGDDEEYFVPITPEKQQTENLRANIGKLISTYSKINDDTALIRTEIKSPDNNMIYSYYDFNNFANDKYYFDILLNLQNQPIPELVVTKAIRPLGKFDTGEKITTEIVLNSDTLYIKHMLFYSLDESRLDAAIEKLHRNEFNITHFEDTYIEGNITAADNQIMFTSISYEPGWTIRVDGKKTEPVKLAGALIGVPMNAGEHTVTFSFFPHGLKLGIILSAIGFVMIIVIAIIEVKQRKVLLKRLYE